MSVREQLMRSPLNKSRQERVQEILNYAASFKGTRYVYGTMGPNSFDCSGFTSYVFKNFGIKLDRTSRGQVADGRQVAKDQVLPGDLVFFGNRGNSRVGHVGIVYDVDEGAGIVWTIEFQNGDGTTIWSGTTAQSAAA